MQAAKRDWNAPPTGGQHAILKCAVYILHVFGVNDSKGPMNVFIKDSSLRCLWKTCRSTYTILKQPRLQSFLFQEPSGYLGVSGLGATTYHLCTADCAPLRICSANMVDDHQTASPKGCWVMSPMKARWIYTAVIRPILLYAESI